MAHSNTTPDLAQPLLEDTGSSKSTVRYVLHTPDGSIAHKEVPASELRLPVEDEPFSPSSVSSEVPDEQHNFLYTVMAMTKVILGTGMLVLPRAFQLLGCVLATCLLVVVGVMTWFTVHGLIYAAEKTAKHTYASVVRKACGRPAKWGLLASIVANCLGMCVAFLVIFGDILVGSAPEYQGVIREIWPDLDPLAWYMDRRLLIAAVLVFVVMPLSLQRDTSKLGPLAMLGVGAVAMFTAAAMLLAGMAAHKGMLQPLPLWPDWQGLANGAGSTGSSDQHGAQEDDPMLGILGAAYTASQTVGSRSDDMNVHAHGGNTLHGSWAKGWLGLTTVLGLDPDSATSAQPVHAALGVAGSITVASVILGVASVIPLLLNADICHQSIFPIMSTYKPYSRRGFNSVMAIALLICNCLYVLLSVGCLAVFGVGLDPNVLNNFNAVSMEPVLGNAALSHGVALLVRLSFFVSLLGSFVFCMDPLRHGLLEVLLGSNFPTKKQAKADRLFVPLTLALLVLVYLISTAVPGVWEVLSMVGSSASTFMGFVFPGVVIMATAIRPKWTHTMQRAVSVAIIGMGLFLFVNGVTMDLFGP